MTNDPNEPYLKAIVAAVTREERRRREAVQQTLAALWRAPAQKAILYALRKGKDVPVSALYSKIHIEPRDSRTQQQYVGAPISKLNARLAEFGFRITPGDRRGTYRIRRTT